MRATVIVALKALIGMIAIALAFVLWASVFNGYPWREQYVGLLVMAATPFVLRKAIRLLEARRRAGALLALLCVFAGPTPMFFEAAWIWAIALGVPLVIVWFQLGNESEPASISARDAE